MTTLSLSRSLYWVATSRARAIAMNGSTTSTSIIFLEAKAYSLSKLTTSWVMSEPPEKKTIKWVGFFRLEITRLVCELSVYFWSREKSQRL